jgi:hypothetical protein
MVAQWAQSGLGKKEYCRRNGLGYANLLYWSAISRKVASVSAPGEGLVPLEVVDRESAQRLWLRGPNGISLSLPLNGVSVDFVKALLIA